MNKIQWTHADDTAASAEGWCVSNTSEGFLEIQRIDDPGSLGYTNERDPVFDSDLDALAHVTCKALEGSDLHKRAILLDGEPMSALA